MLINELFHSIWHHIYWPSLHIIRWRLFSVWNVPLRDETWIEYVLGRGVELGALNSPELPDPRGHAIEEVNVHLMIVKLGAVEVDVLVMAHVDLDLQEGLILLPLLVDHGHELSLLLLYLF